VELPDILRTVDLAALKPDTTMDQIITICDVAKYNKVASVCVSPPYVSSVADLLYGSGILTCCVVGFPSGAHTIAVKYAEAEDAIADGAQELDVVGNIADLKQGHFLRYRQDVKVLVDLAHRHNVVLKVILETCYLTPIEIAEATVACCQTGADYVKTSTGFGSEGATPEAASLMLTSTKDFPTLVKASGGIATIEDARMYLQMGCKRLGLGLSSLNAIVNGQFHGKFGY
jgi:deoxyribose-phosphate aldolase